MLTVEAISDQHHPRAIGDEPERPAADEVIRLRICKEGQRKPRTGTMPKENQPVSFDGGKDLLPGKRRSRLLGRHAAADAIGCIFPAVKWALQTIANDLAASQIGAAMRTARVEDRDALVGCPKGNQSTPEQVLRDWTLTDLSADTEQIPSRRLRGKCIFQRSVDDRR
jgi:hypothetical protein